MKINRVPQELYDENYFLNFEGGWEKFKKTNGTVLGRRMKYGLKLLSPKKNEKILDFGCGRGELVINVAKSGAEAWGLDYSESAIKIANNNKSNFSNLNLNYKVSNYKLDFDDDYFDAIIFMDVMEHIYQEELELLFKEFYRVLKTGGRLIIQTSPNRRYKETGYLYYTRFLNLILSKLITEPFMSKKMKYSKEKEGHAKLFHVNEQTPEMVEKILAKNGFNYNVWISDFCILSLRNKIMDTIRRPSWVPFLKRYFGTNIWAIGIKK